jgi:hypothetical protein
LAVVAAERRGERVGRCVAGAFRHLRERRLTGAQVIARERHAQVGQVLQRGLPQRSLEAPRAGGPREPADGCQLRDRPRVRGLLVDGLQRRTQARVGRRLEPPGGVAALPEARADGEDEKDVEEAVEDGLLAGLCGGELLRQHSDDIAQGVADGCRERQYLWQRAEQPLADVTGKPVGAAQEHCGSPVTDTLVVRVPRPELCGLEAGGPWLMGG